MPEFFRVSSTMICYDFGARARFFAFALVRRFSRCEASFHKTYKIIAMLFGVCGSGLKAVHLAYQSIRDGDNLIAIGGGQGVALAVERS